MRNLYYMAVGLLMLFASCSDWLDVKPKTNVEEEDLFKNEQGFKEALTGVYIKLSETQLYGRELTYGFLSQLANATWPRRTKTPITLKTRGTRIRRPARRPTSTTSGWKATTP